MDGIEARETALNQCAMDPRGARSELYDRALHPIFAEIRNVLAPLASNVTMARAALADMRPSRGGAPADARRALVDLDDLLREIEHTSTRLLEALAALQEATLGGGAKITWAELCSVAGQLAHHHTKVVGGVSWSPAAIETPVLGERQVALTLLAASLSAVATRLYRRRLSGGIAASASSTPLVTTIELRASELSPHDLRDCASELAALVDGEPAIRVTASADAVVLSFAEA